MGRPAYLPEPSQRRQVEAMAGYGVPEYDVARVLGIDAEHVETESGKGSDALARRARS